MALIVISGGQTGVDRAALVAAKRCGLKTGGMMPRGFMALDGKHPEFVELYGVRQHPTSDKYPPRTEWNVVNSNATLSLAKDWDSPGERLTRRLIIKYHRPFYYLSWPFSEDAVGSIIEWIVTRRFKVLNVAGNSERTAPGIYDGAVRFLSEVFAALVDLDK